MRRRTYTMDDAAAAYVDARAKASGQTASSVVGELVTEAARLEARDHALERLGAGIDIPEREVERWLKKLGA